MATFTQRHLGKFILLGCTLFSASTYAEHDPFNQSLELSPTLKLSANLQHSAAVNQFSTARKDFIIRANYDVSSTTKFSAYAGHGLDGASNMIGLKFSWRLKD